MGGKHSTTTSKVSIPKEVLERYNAVNARAEAAANTPYKAFGNTASDYVAQMNAQQNAGINDINAMAGSYIPYMDKATAATTAGMGPAYEGIDRYMSPYIKDVADTTGAMMRQQYEQAQSGALGTAASSGAFGGDRAGIAAANMQQQNQMGYGNTMANIYNQGYTQALGASQADLARQLQGGAQMAGLGAQSQQLGLQGAQAKIAAGTMQQQTEQAGKDAMIQRFMQEQGYPFQTAQFLANIAMGTGAAQGSTTTTETPRNWLGFAQGGGVAGPRTYSQGTIGGDGYVPAGDLPVGQLMVAPPPEQQQGGGTEEIIALITKAMGAAHGGAIDQRHGYADGGSPFTDELRHWLASRDEVSGLGLADRARSQANTAAAMASKYDNPANSMAPPVVMPNAIPANAPMVNKPTGDIEAWDQPPVRGGQTEARAIPVRSGPTGLDTPVRSGPTGLDTPVRSGPTGLDTPIRSGATPMAPVGGVGGPGTFTAGAMPSELALHRPQPRPADLGVPAARYDFPTGLGVAAPAGGVAADALRTIKVDPMLINGGKSVPAAPAVVATGPQTDTGVVPQGGYNPIVPLKTELAFVTHELQQPQYRGYLEQKYATPEQAAVQFESIYEKSNGAGNDVAAANARNIFDAARNGNLDSLPPNVAEAYNHFVQNGMDPVQAAGATGRLMVESYARLDPNARNTLGGGNGTFGIAQWRGSRMEDLAKFAGVPLDALTGAPVSTPEGRYYSTGAKTDGGLGGADMTAGQEAPAGGVKPYEDRNMIGKFFHEPNGKLNPNAVMALLSGIGHAAEAQTISPIGALLSGIGAGSDTYKGLLKQSADVTKTNLENIKEISRGTMAWNAMPNHTKITPAEYARMVGMPMDAATQKLLEGMSAGAATGGKNYLGAPLNPYGTGMTENVTRPDGSVVKAYNDIGYLQRLLAEQQPLVFAGVLDPSAMTETQNRIIAIQNNGGRVPLEDGSGGYVVDPIYAEGQAAAVATKRGSDLQEALPDLKNAADTATTTVNQLGSSIAAAVATGETGALSKLYSKGSSFWEAVGGGSGNYAALDEEVKKSLAEFLRQKTGDDSTDYQTSIAQGALPDLAKQPAANAWVLATMQAQADRENARVDAISKAATPQEAAANEINITNNFPLEERTRQHYEENLKKFGVPDPTKIDISATPSAGSAPQWFLDQGFNEQDWRNLPANKGSATPPTVKPEADVYSEPSSGM